MALGSPGFVPPLACSIALAPSGSGQGPAAGSCISAMASAICDPPFRSNDGGMNDGRSVGLAPLPWMQLDRQARRYLRGLYSPEETSPELGGRRAIGAPLLPTLTSPAWFGKKTSGARQAR
jgi:hypothetical protein